MTNEADEMGKEQRGLQNERALWVLVGLVVFLVILVLVAVFENDKSKARSPQAFVAAALNRPVFKNEWKPGRGPEPLIYHPAAMTAPAWQPLYICPQDGATGPPGFDAVGTAHCTRCGQVMYFNSK